MTQPQKLEEKKYPLRSARWGRQSFASRQPARAAHVKRAAVDVGEDKPELKGGIDD